MATTHSTFANPQKYRPLGVLIILAFILFFVLAAYTTLHEGGHALVGFLFGGKLTAFSVNFMNITAHVSFAAAFPDGQQSWVSLAGPSLVFALWALLIALMPQKASLVTRWLAMVSSMAVINSLLPWVIFPFLYMNGQMPPDDSITFLSHSGLSPLLVSAIALLVYIGGWAWFLFKMGGITRLLSQFRKLDLSIAESRRVLAAMVITTGILLAVTFGLDSYLVSNSPLVPEDYVSVAVINLKDEALAARPVYRFNLDGPARASFFFLLQDIEKGPIEIALVGPNGFRSTFMQAGATWAARQATVNPTQIELEGGEYQVQLTFSQNAGRVSVYIKQEPRNSQPLSQ